MKTTSIWAAVTTVAVIGTAMHLSRPIKPTDNSELSVKSNTVVGGMTMQVGYPRLVTFTNQYSTLPRELWNPYCPRGWTNAVVINYFTNFWWTIPAFLTNDTTNFYCYELKFQTDPADVYSIQTTYHDKWQFAEELLFPGNLEGFVTICKPTNDTYHFRIMSRKGMFP